MATPSSSSPVSEYDGVFEDVDGSLQFQLHNVSDFQDFEVLSRFNPTHIARDCIYKDKKALDFHLKMYAISNLFQYKTRTSNRKVLHVVCLDDDCIWAVRAVRLGGCQMFQIRRFDSVHICSLDFRQGLHRQATSDIIAELIKSRYADASRKPYAPKDIIADMIHNYGIALPYKKAWNANRKAQQKLMGSDEESYQLLPSLAHVLKEKHP
ncbi:unnamed protein product, partial [Cuscuta epithymum]